METIRQYNRQRLLVCLMETAKEFTTMVAMVKLVAFISAQLRLHTVIVSEAASTRKTKIVNDSNHFISILAIKYLSFDYKAFQILNLRLSRR